MLPMTKVGNAPTSDQAKPGMAFFAGTGPFGATCGDCIFRGYKRDSRVSHWDEGLQQDVYRSRSVQKCRKVKEMTGRHGADVDASNSARKYFEQKPK